MKRDISQPFGIDHISFRKCFSAPSYRMFIALIVGWVLTVGRHTVSQVILTMRLHESKHFASIYRFLGKARWQASPVSYCLFRLLVGAFHPRGGEIVAVTDDTLNKHCGRSICGAGWQHDGSASTRSEQKGYGVCFVIMGLAVRLPGISDRVFCLPYAARLWWPPKANVAPRTLPYKTKPELALDLITQTHSWLKEGEQLRIVTDRGYSCDTVLKGRPHGVHVTGRLRTDAALFSPLEPSDAPRRGRPRRKGYRLPTPATLFKDPTLKWSETKVLCYRKQIRPLVHQFRALWYHSAGAEPVSVVLCRDPRGRYEDGVLFDTDVHAQPAQTIERYAARWSIEVTNREVKQLLGAEDPQCRTELAVMRSPLFAYWAYSFVVLWFVERYANQKKPLLVVAPWYTRKTSFTFSDMLAEARRSHFSLNISSNNYGEVKLQKNNGPRSTRQLQTMKIAKL